jgi:hypothetical protein
VTTWGRDRPQDAAAIKQTIEQQLDRIKEVGFQVLDVQDCVITNRTDHGGWLRISDVVPKAVMMVVFHPRGCECDLRVDPNDLAEYPTDGAFREAALCGP